MDLNKLRYFLTAAETEHVTNAAKKLNISQPVLTRAIHDLEDELGLKLFAHEGRNVKLTSQGKQLYRVCAPAMQELKEAETALKREGAKKRNSIKVCIKAASVLTVNAIASFSALHPDAKIELTQNAGADGADIVIDTAKAQEMGGRYTFTERIGVAVPLDFIKQGQTTTSLSALGNENFIMLSETSDFRKLCDALCKKCGFTPRIVYESDNPDIVRKLFNLKLGVGFWAEYSWGQVGSNNVAWLSLDEALFTRTIRISITPDGMENLLAHEFRDHLNQAFEASWK